MRDLYKTAESAKLNKYYDIEVRHILDLIESLPGTYVAFNGEMLPVSDEWNAAWKAIVTAFKYGYVMGQRAERKRAQRAKK